MEPLQPIAEKCPACGYILNPENNHCLQCGYEPCRFCDENIEKAMESQDE